MLIGSDFFDTYDTTMCHKEGIFKIMGHSFPLLKIDGSLRKSPSQGNFKSTMLVHCSSGNIGVAIDNKDTSCYLPKEIFFEDPIIHRCRDNITIFPNKQVSVATGLKIHLPLGIHGTIGPISFPKPNQPITAGVLLLAKASEFISILLANSYSYSINLVRVLPLLRSS